MGATLQVTAEMVKRCCVSSCIKCGRRFFLLHNTQPRAENYTIVVNMVSGQDSENQWVLSLSSYVYSEHFLSGKHKTTCVTQCVQTGCLHLNHLKIGYAIQVPDEVQHAQLEMCKQEDITIY